jgi:hypothetical protein
MTGKHRFRRFSVNPFQHFLTYPLFDGYLPGNVFHNCSPRIAMDISLLIDISAYKVTGDIRKEVVMLPAAIVVSRRVERDSYSASFCCKG